MYYNTDFVDLDLNSLFLLYFSTFKYPSTSNLMVLKNILHNDVIIITINLNIHTVTFYFLCF